MSHADGSRVNEYDDSHVLLVEYQGTRILFVGDLHERGEQRALAAGPAPVQILKVAEHGSAEGSSAAFLAAIHPRLAILSFAAVNAFDLPNPLVMTRLAQAGIGALNTAEHGTITITVDGYAWRRTASAALTRCSASKPTSRRYCESPPTAAYSISRVALGHRLDDAPGGHRLAGLRAHRLPAHPGPGGLVRFAPSLALSMVSGAVVDAYDRRVVLMFAQAFR